MKFVIIGSSLTGNKGASAMLESSIQTLSEKYPDAQFTLLSISPKQDRALNTYENLRILNAKPIKLGAYINSMALAYKILIPFRKFIRKNVPSIDVIAECDAYLDQGGITFSDGREKFLIFNVASILPALMIGKPVIKCAQALGTFKNPINRFVAKLILPKVKLIIARGEKTFEHLMELGLDNVVQGADYAFALDIVESELRDLSWYTDETIFNDGRKVVGIAPSVVVKKYCDANDLDYMEIMKSCINNLIEEGYGVLLVPHSVKINSKKVHNNDLPLCIDLYREVGDEENVVFIDEELSSQELRYLIGKCDFFVASRFHSMVSSLAMEVPTLVIGWSHKYAEVLKMFDLEEYAFGFDKLTPEYLNQRFSEMVEKESDIKSKIESNLPKVKKLSNKHVEYISNVVNN